MFKKTLYTVFMESFEAGLFRGLKALLPENTMNSLQAPILNPRLKLPRLQWPLLQ